jgi:AcrR family transcriptional regulator
LSSRIDNALQSGETLPRGPHGLSREQVGESQRARLERALIELLAERGYAGVTIGELARRARVSRGAFYEHFDDKQTCLFSAYDRFAGGLLAAMTEGVGEGTTWTEFVEAALRGYLGTLERDPVAARAFLVEMDAAGPEARERRRQGVLMLATMLQERHELIRRSDPTLAPLPDAVYLGLCLGVRELIRDRLEAGDPAPLTELAPAIVFWVTATVRGATTADR